MKKFILALTLAIPIAAFAEEEAEPPMSLESAQIECKYIVSDLMEINQYRLDGIPVWVAMEDYSFLESEVIMFIYRAPQEVREDPGGMSAGLYSLCLKKRGHSL